MKNNSGRLLTYFAAAEKASEAEVESSYHILKNDPVLRTFQDAMPDLAMILNTDRQLVFANSNLIKFLDIEDSHLPLGDRLGDLLSCIHSEEQPSGCGTTKACRFCGVVNAIVESQLLGKPVVREARISARSEEEITSYDLKIKASPLHYKNQDFTILSINDISDRKRRAILETSYINEIFDTASELKKVVSLIDKEGLDNSNRSIIENAERMNHELMLDLHAQKILNEAEDGKLVVAPALCNTAQFFRELEGFYKSQPITEGKKFFIDPFSHSVKFVSDKQIVMHVLSGIINNAFEATGAGKTIKVGARLNDKLIKFWIYNPEELTEEAKHQIFQRSFSTKGANRGIGTYMARLLSSKYLKGRVYFTSDENGTTFFLEVPLNLNS